jgi:predicted O-methyltransferase YrrM
MKTENQLPLQPLRDVEAQLRTAEVETMIEYVKKAEPPNCYLEVGTKFGGSAYLVYAYINDGCDVYSVDPNPQLYMFKGKENEIGINWIKSRSVEASKEWNGKPIGLLFIDGDHGEGTITAPIDDFNAWEKFVPSGGIIIMHDYHQDFPCVIDACNQIEKSGKFDILSKPPRLEERQDTSMFVVKKL